MSKIATGIILAHGTVLFWLASCERDVEPVISDQEGAVNYENHEDSADYFWDSTQVVQIILKGNSIEVNSSRAIADGSKVTIVSAGTYSISGSLLDGQIIVDAADGDTVRLLLNGLDIQNSTGAPVYILNALKTIILLAENTDNHVQDGAVYQQSTEEPNTAIFSKTDLTIFGDGSLTVDGMYNDGIASKDGLIITNGNITVNAADDALHSYTSLLINGGTFAITTGDDGIHADSVLVIENGNISISESYEGIESAMITINGGDIHIVSSDDGLNGAGGRDGSGIDVNGKIEMNGGNVIIHGPISDMNSAVDYDASFKITGGFLIGAGSSRMAQAPGTGSTQCSIQLDFRSRISAGTLFHIQSSDGMEILTIKPAKDFQSIAFSSPALLQGTVCDVFLGGSSTGEMTDGLYLDGTYTPGSKTASFTISLSTTKISIQ